MGSTHIFDKITHRVNKLLDTHLCIGITGLSQSGKSTFITSLINQLLNHDKAQLSGFIPAYSGRLLSVRMHPLNDAQLMPFPYQSNFQALCEPSSTWPPSSTGASGCLLELRFKSPQSINPLKRSHFSLYLEIRDYPGEWLLDLPLREMSFSRWSSQCSAQYVLEPRLSLLGDLLPELQAIDPLAQCNHTHLKALQQRFKEFLRRCKQQDNTLSLIQPGRFLLTDGQALADELYFVPLLNCHSYSEAQLKAADKNSYYKVCEQQYKRYVKELVEPFYKHFFSKIDRQIVLVDIINALNGGPAYLTDMRQALTNILDSFNYGAQNRLLQLFNPKIDKVVFAATKVDQVLSQDHQAVRQLLANLLKQAYNNAAHQGIEPHYEAVAAVRAATEVQHKKQLGITGLNASGQEVGYINPSIPTQQPSAEQWQEFSKWPVLKLYPPRNIKFENNDALPHIRLDTVLNHLIADKCQ